MVIKIAGIAAAVGPAIMMFGKLVTTVGTGLRVFNTIAKSIKIAGGAISLLTSPVGLVIVGILALIAAIALVIKNFDKIRRLPNNLHQILRKNFLQFEK